jgi:glutamate--cysteine ligase
VPVAVRQLTLDGARDHIAEACLDPCSRDSADLVGLESEWLPVVEGRPSAPVALDDLVSAVRSAPPLPGGSTLTYEPGGQLELSTPPAADMGSTCTDLAADLATLRPPLAEEGLGLVGAGLDPARPPQRVVRTPRYAAMEAFFDADGPAGRRMMCSTASVQVNVGLGGGALDRRWRLAHDLGPTLVATFANSPLADGRPTGWRSARMATWWSIDRSRTAPVEGPAGAFLAYALRAHVLFVRRDADTFVPLDRRLPFAAWLEHGHELGFPSLDDLTYHLTTLFPPVRPKGWLELRYLDAVPDPWWRVAATATAALLTDGDCAQRAAAAAAGTEGLWLEAARHGLAHPGLARSARLCFDAVLDALDRVGADPCSAALVADFADRYVARRRTPADDLLAGHGATSEP